MAVATIPFSERLGFSRLTRDYILHPEKTRRFFGEADFASIAKALADTAYDRNTMADLLARQNRAWGASTAVLQNIDKLRQPNAIAVFAGQQACLFGGPYLVLLKALAAAKWAARLEQELSRPVVPVFWIASDDHDIPEIASVSVFDASGKIVGLSIDGRGDTPSPPIGALTYDESIAREIGKLEDIFPDNDFKDDAYAVLARLYRSGGHIVDAFARYMLELTTRSGLVLFNPYDREFKEATAPLMAEIVSKQDAMRDALSETAAALIEGGYHLQAEKSDTAAHLFYHNPGRTALHRDGDAFRAGDQTFSEKTLRDMIKSRPLDYSPDVFTRALVQSSFFPAAAIVCGPAEVAYYAQMMSLFDVFDLVRPRIILRPSVTVVESRDQELLSSHGLSFEDVIGDFEAIINQILSDTFPEELDKTLSSHRENARREMHRLREILVAFDANLSGTVDHTEKKIDFLLGELDKKVFAAHKKKNSVERGRLYRLRDHLWPNGATAERAIAPAYFISRYGSGIIDFIYKSARLDETGHQLLMLSDYNGR